MLEKAMTPYFENLILHDLDHSDRPGCDSTPEKPGRKPVCGPTPTLTVLLNEAPCHRLQAVPELSSQPQRREHRYRRRREEGLSALPFRNLRRRPGQSCRAADRPGRCTDQNEDAQLLAAWSGRDIAACMRRRPGRSGERAAPEHLLHAHYGEYPGPLQPRNREGLRGRMVSQGCGSRERTLERRQRPVRDVRPGRGLEPDALPGRKHPRRDRSQPHGDAGPVRPGRGPARTLVPPYLPSSFFTSGTTVATSKFPL